MEKPSTLLACLRWDPSGDERLRGLGADDWNRLWAIVQAGAGQALLARRLALSGVRPPRDIARQLRTDIMSVIGRNLAGRNTLATTVRATGKPALLLKGVDLDERLYGNIGLRRMSDVDFLVRVGDVAAYDAHLRRQGYQPTPHPTKAIVVSDNHCNAQYRAEGTRKLPLELHWRLANDSWSRSVDEEGIWARAIPHPQFAPDAHVMAPEDLVLYLCLHLKHHTFGTPLTQIWDLAEIVRSSSFAVDWPTVRARAREWRLTEALGIALYMVSDVLGVSTRHACDWTPAPAVTMLLPDIMSNLGRFPRVENVTSWRLSYFLSSQSGWRERCRALKDGVLPPRAEIRARYGRPQDALWNDCVSYLCRWRYLARMWGGVFRQWLAGEPTVKRHIERAAALRRHLDAG